MWDLRGTGAGPGAARRVSIGDATTDWGRWRHGLTWTDGRMDRHTHGPITQAHAPSAMPRLAGGPSHRSAGPRWYGLAYGSAITRNPKTGAVITRNYTVITLHLKLHKRRVVYTGRQRHRTQSQQSALQSYVITAHRRHATVPPMCGAVLSSITPRPVTLHLESRASLCQALGTGTTSAPLRGRLHARRIYALAVG